MEKYKLTIEFRYKRVPKQDWQSDSTSQKITIGIYDTYEEACIQGNKELEKFEKIFPLNKNSRNQRFSRNGGVYGSKENLITNLGYLETPFYFFAKISTLYFKDVNETIEEVLDFVKDYDRNKQF